MKSANSAGSSCLQQRFPLFLGIAQLLCAVLSLALTAHFFWKRAETLGAYANRPTVWLTTVSIAVLAVPGICAQFLTGILAVRQTEYTKHLWLRRIISLLSIAFNILSSDLLHTRETLSLCFALGAVLSSVYLLTLFRRKRPRLFPTEKNAVDNTDI